MVSPRAYNISFNVYFTLTSALVCSYSENMYIVFWGENTKVTNELSTVAAVLRVDDSDRKKSIPENSSTIPFKGRQPLNMI